MKIHGLPQTLSGSEIVTIKQEQNGHWAECSMPLSMLSSILQPNWTSLPTVKPSLPGVLWNDNGVVAIS